MCRDEYAEGGMIHDIQSDVRLFSGCHNFDAVAPTAKTVARHHMLMDFEDIRLSP
jgi:hypothetical protein